MQLRRLKPDPLNLSVNTGVGKQLQEYHFLVKCFLYFRSAFFILIKLNIYAGGLLAVEKVKPDPLNLSVNTGEGKQSFILR